MIGENKEWYKFDGATDDELSSLVNHVDFELPQKYLELLKFSNGGEGPLSVQPFNFVLDNIEDTISMFSSEHYRNLYHGYFIFGGNGAGELMALKIRTGEIISFDSTNSDLEEASLFVSKCFDEFVNYIGIEDEQT